MREEDNSDCESLKFQSIFLGSFAEAKRSGLLELTRPLQNREDASAHGVEHCQDQTHAKQPFFLLLSQVGSCFFTAKQSEDTKI